MSELTILHDAKFTQLMSRDGWEFLDRKNTNDIVAMLAVTDDDEIILIEQFRPPHQQNIIEPPAGLVDDGESIIDAAHRELLEETGYSAKSMERLTKVALSPGATSETITLVRASGLTLTGQGGGVAEEGENITVHRIPIKSVRKWLQSCGVLIESTVHSILYFL